MDAEIATKKRIWVPRLILNWPAAVSRQKIEATGTFFIACPYKYSARKRILFFDLSLSVLYAAAAFQPAAQIGILSAALIKHVLQSQHSTD
jgi:hypothetical protein